MICTCLFPIARIPTLMANLNANLAAAGNVSGSLSAAASGAASAAASAAAAASANAALNTALTANAVASLTAAANFVATMNATFHINLLDPLNLIEAAIADLVNSISTNGLPGAVSAMPLPSLPKLQALEAVANAALAANMAAAAGLMANSNVAAQLAAALNATGAMSGSLAGSANLGLVLAAMAAAKAGFGVNLAASGSMSALGSKLDTLGSNINSSPMQSLGSVIPLGTLAKAVQMLDALAAIKKALGVDLTKPGAGASLNKALGGNLADSLGKSADMSKSLGKNLSAGKNVNDSASGNEQCEAAASQMIDEGWNDVSKKIPAVPKGPNLLAALVNALLSVLGLDVVQNQPCGKKCLFALASLFSPMGCLCPKAGS